jgi:hypothetical protein
MEPGLKLLPGDMRYLIIDSVVDPRTLAALARISSVVSPIALDKLWSNLNSLCPLASVMREDLRNELESDD